MFTVEKILVEHRKSITFTRKVEFKKVKLLLNLIYVPLLWDYYYGKFHIDK